MSKERTLFRYFLLILVIATARGSSNEFDVLIFTQRWPQTVCYLWKERSTSHTCTLPKEEEWTIHGIWPTQYHKSGPQFCNSSLPFNATVLKPLEKTLLDKWIDIEHGENPYSFWEHEWNKHGRCAAVLEKLNTEAKYFQEGLTLLNAYDMTHVLAKASILPGNKYPIQDIIQAINKILGRNAEVTCAKSQKYDEFYIFEIRICFNKSLELIDCDGIIEYPTNCRLNAEVIYPTNVPHYYNVIQV